MSGLPLAPRRRRSTARSERMQAGSGGTSSESGESRSPHQIVQYGCPPADAGRMSELAQAPASEDPTGQLPVGDLVARLVDLARVQLGRDITWGAPLRRLWVDGEDRGLLADPEVRFVEILTATL